MLRVVFFDCQPFCWKEIDTAIFLKEIFSAVLVFSFYRQLQKLLMHLQKLSRLTSILTSYPECPTMDQNKMAISGFDREMQYFLTTLVL